MGTYVNCDPKTGIRYGVILVTQVLQAWYDCAEELWAAPCPFCDDYTFDNIPDAEVCPKCGATVTADDFIFSDPIGYRINDEEIYATQEAGDRDIFVIRSKYKTLCGLCSPCAPNAGDLLSRTEAVWAYCFGPDWFEDPLPYDVYDAVSGALLYKRGTTCPSPTGRGTARTEGD